MSRGKLLLLSSAFVGAFRFLYFIDPLRIELSRERRAAAVAEAQTNPRVSVVGE